MKKYYVYRIYHEIENKYYIGSRTISERIDILNGYNTSSKVVKNLIKDYGIDKFKIDYILEFKSAKDAINKENEILQKITDRENYLNVNFSAGGAVIKSQSHFQIYNELTNEYIYHPKNVKIPIGWIKKSSFKPPSRKGYKQLINLKTKETIYLNLLENKLPEGWMIKTEYDKEIYNGKEKRTVWITNDIINKKIRKSDKLPTGWRFGKISNRPKNIKITNGKINKYVDCESKIIKGWWRGQHEVGNITTKDKIIINNGKINKYINKTDNIDDGWHIGPIPKRIYKVDDKKFNYKKDIIAYLNMTVAQFEYAIKKNKLKVEIEEINLNGYNN